ncbi:hypothetical protein RvY_04817 [Ramazzottius varieornatus]|uniref:Zinc transporter ZIP13 n=1 Tax=Ramazzottius varieornatus TaxID=947166 RepID=A0A1D1UZI8_RAMVA|nr:hypothetical protein RvY_04817 [Ramazzottius varieornatus]
MSGTCHHDGMESSGSCRSPAEEYSDILSLHDAWLYSIIATLMVSACGLIPVLFIPLDGAKSISSPGGASKLRMFLAFAVGSLLGDVFLHLLPEAWRKSSSPDAHTTNGLFVVFGIISFSLIEKLCQATDDETDDTQTGHSSVKKNGIVHGEGDNSFVHISKEDDQLTFESSAAIPRPTSWVTGYLNLFANCVDNFTHGLAIGGSFLVSSKVGMLTTFAILIHEIPHEIGDFAILVRSGFSRTSAAKAQVFTLMGGLLGAATALWFESVDDIDRKSTWILPFAAGGFLNISLVNLLPELLQERSIRESLKQMTCLSIGVLSMASVQYIFEA